jgi:hypothetical protein
MFRLRNGKLVEKYIPCFLGWNGSGELPEKENVEILLKHVNFSE